jgi:hypothetical protein
MTLTTSNSKEHKMQKQYHNADDDFEIVRGKKVLKDGRIFRTKMTVMDNAMSHRPIARVTTADGDPLSMTGPAGGSLPLMRPAIRWPVMSSPTLTGKRSLTQGSSTKTN